MNWKIPLSDVDFGPEEEKAILRVLRSKWLSMGSETLSFEEEFAAYLGVKHAVAVSNGTAALHLALLALGIGAGDAVIQPAVNFVASANMTVAVGAVPVFADLCSLAEPTVSPDSIESLLESTGSITRSPRPRAVVVMHYGGYPCRMEEITRICQERNLYLIEDACHGIGAIYRNKERKAPANLGTIGDIGCFSFFSNKNMATGEGGMVVTNRDDLADSVRKLRSHGMTSLTWDRHKGHAATYDVVVNGFNYRIDEIRSAVGREQLKKLEKNNTKRRSLTALYWQKLAFLEEKGWIIPFREAYLSALESGFQNSGRNTRGSLPACHLLPVVAPDENTRWKAAEYLKSSGIQTSLHYPLITSFSAFEARQEHEDLKLSSKFTKQVITLPLYPEMTGADISCIAEKMASV